MNALLTNIAEKASEDLRKLIEEGADDILSAIHKMTAEAELQETKPKFNLGFSISIDPDKGAFETKLSWTVKQSLSIEHAIEDPNQGKLPIESEPTTITISTDGVEPVTLTAEQLKKAAKEMRNK